MLKGEAINSLPTYSRIKKGITYLRSQQSVFTSLTVEEQRRLAKTDGQLFGNTLNCETKGGNLSGGEKQKLLFDLLSYSDVNLFDEPMIGLDWKTISVLSNKIWQIYKDKRIILITVPNLREV